MKKVWFLRDLNPGLWHERPLLLPLHYRKHFKNLKILEKSFSMIFQFFQNGQIRKNCKNEIYIQILVSLLFMDQN